jgi:hypothetical protein
MRSFARRLLAALARGPVLQVTCPGCPDRGKCPPDCWCACHRSTVYLAVDDAAGRLARVEQIAASALLDQYRRPAAHRDIDVVNLCLDVRNAAAGPAGSTLLDRPLPRRYPVPVVAGPDGAEYPAARP